MSVELQIKREVTLIPIYADPLQAAQIVRICCKTSGREVLIDGLPELQLVAFRTDAQTAIKIRGILENIDETAKRKGIHPFSRLPIRKLTDEDKVVEIFRAGEILRSP